MAPTASESPPGSAQGADDGSGAHVASPGPTPSSASQQEVSTTATDHFYALDVDFEGPTASQTREAEEALRARPFVSLRLRIFLVFALMFLLSAGIIAWSLVSNAETQRRVKVLETAGNYQYEVQQARRYEKNYLLYGHLSHLQEAAAQTRQAEELLRTSRAELEPAIGRAGYRRMVEHLDRYRALLAELGRRHGRAAGPGTRSRSQIERALREHGAAMVRVAGRLVEQERRLVAHRYRTTRTVLLGFLGIFLVLSAYLAYFITRQIHQPLTRFVDYAQRIGAGDFSPILPSRRYQDEFSRLSLAFNRMIAELDHREHALVESHKLRAIGTLTAGVAHELNNPINNIVLTAEMLDEDYEELEDAERVEMVRDIIAQADRASRIVRDLLDFSRQRELEMEPVDVSDLVAHSLRLATNQIKLRKARSAFEREPDLPLVHGAPQQLKQVFLNLILNALDALPERDGRIDIRVRRHESDRGLVAVEISDNGPGIPPRVLDKIFDPFFSTKKQKGTGLGLSVSLGIVRKHGGRIQVRTAVGEGSTFMVLLPVAAGLDPTTGAPLSQDARSSSHRSGLRPTMAE